MNVVWKSGRSSTGSSNSTNPLTNPIKLVCSLFLLKSQLRLRLFKISMNLFKIFHLLQYFSQSFHKFRLINTLKYNDKCCETLLMSWKLKHSLWNILFTVKYIELVDKAPRCAFGRVIPDLKPQYSFFNFYFEIKNIRNSYISTL